MVRVCSALPGSMVDGMGAPRARHYEPAVGNGALSCADRPSVNPVFAALIGMLVLDQHLSAPSWLAITMIVAANAISVGTASNRSTKKTDLLQ